MAVKESPLANPTTPVEWDDYTAEKVERQVARDKRHKELRKCLDPEYAERMEKRKAVYTFLVDCTWNEKDDKGRHQTKTAKHEFMAQNETDAWAMFCDKIKHWPSRSACDFTIKNLGKAE